MSPTRIKNLAEDSLLQILEELPVRDQIYLRAVCPHWKAVIEQRIFAPKRSLKIFGTKEDLLKYGQIILKRNLHGVKHFQLHLGGHKSDHIISNDLTFFEQVPLLFPNLRQLLIQNTASDWRPVFPSVVDALTKLENLALYGLKRADSDSFPPPVNWSAIRGLNSLKELHLFGKGWGSMKIPVLLGRLKQFSLTKEAIDDYNSDILQQLGSNIRVLRLAYSPIMSSHLQANPLITANLTHLTLVGNFITRNNICTIIGKLKQLTFLDLGTIDIMHLTDALTMLSELPLLTETFLKIVLFSWDQLGSLSFCPSVPSVKRLHFAFSVNLNEEIFYGFVPKIFPNIEYLQMDPDYYLFKYCNYTEINPDKMFQLFPHLKQYKAADADRVKLEQVLCLIRYLPQSRKMSNSPNVEQTLKRKAETQDKSRRVMRLVDKVAEITPQEMISSVNEWPPEYAQRALNGFCSHMEEVVRLWQEQGSQTHQAPALVQAGVPPPSSSSQSSDSQANGPPPTPTVQSTRPPEPTEAASSEANSPLLDSMKQFP